ncbi:hypothetical protein [Nocardia brasiliensis]|uniref:hypothetical protein n=1 Tax=Nocardia brasiliensis TaxID=37326 RepID=UPI0002527104|nr:hypothetical protein [Nocardia brasiliensis]OCF86436.1 hypothetical protein AW168_30570 [Nocardia brasiliensis]
MELPLLQGAGEVPEVTSVRTVALYEAGSGRIVHQHVAVVFAGGRDIPEAEAIETARASAAEAGHQPKELKVALSNDPRPLRGPHRIDPGTGAFVRIANPEAGRRGPSVS